MESVHSMAFADDGTVYVCNRYGNQIRLYDKMGNFKRTFDYPWQPATVPADGKIEQSGGATPIAQAAAVIARSRRNHVPARPW
jgi:hypothetical protein